MSNPGGGNQFGNYTLQPKYGDVKKQTQLTREAPISGSPFAQQALNTPRRQQRQASRQLAQRQVPPVMAANPEPVGPAPATYKAIAAIPGASPLVQQIFGA